MKRGFSLDDLTATISGDSSGGVMGKKRSKNGHNKGTAAASQPTTTKNNDASNSIIDDVINDVLSQSASQQSHQEVLRAGSVGSDDGRILTDTTLVQLLLERIEKQQTVIEKLERKLDSALSFMGIPDIDTVTGACDMNVQTHVPEDDNQGMGITPSYATMASHRYVSKPTGAQPRNLSDAVVTAIHKEQMNKDRRSKTVVVSGFPEGSSASSDRENFRQLCSTELDTAPDIIYVKRLGTSQARARPLLVAVRTSGEAANLVERSKSVNRAAATDMRNVYINPNLSKAESKAAYVERCRRRLAAQRRGELRESSGQSSGRRDRSVNNNHISRDNANRSQVAATSRSSLNPTASEFTASGLRDTRSGM